MEDTFLQVIGLVDGEPDGDRARVVPEYFVFFYGRALGAPAVLGGGGGGEVPFYVAGAVDEGDVIEVDYLARSARE